MSGGSESPKELKERLLSSHGLNPQSLDECQAAFKRVDKDGSGFVDASELKLLFQESGEVDLTEEDLAKCVAEVEKTRSTCRGGSCNSVSASFRSL